MKVEAIGVLAAPREDSYEAHSGKERRGQGQYVGKRVAQRGADEEEWCDFTALEACTQGDCGKEKLRRAQS